MLGHLGYLSLFVVRNRAPQLLAKHVDLSLLCVIIRIDKWLLLKWLQTLKMALAVNLNLGKTFI